MEYEKSIWEDLQNAILSFSVIIFGILQKFVEEYLKVGVMFTSPILHNLSQSSYCPSMMYNISVHKMGLGIWFWPGACECGVCMWGVCVWSEVVMWLMEVVMKKVTTSITHNTTSTVYTLNIKFECKFLTFKIMKYSLAQSS